MASTSARIDLASAIPLPSPLGMLVEPTNICNFRCSICPESLGAYSHEAGYYEAMKWDTWVRIVDQLRNWGVRVKVMRFYFLGEPLLNPRIAEMIQAARYAGITERTEVTTNGSLLSERKCAELLSSGLDYIRISVYGTDAESYRQATNSRFSIEDIIANGRRLREMRDTAGGYDMEIHAELTTMSDDNVALFESQWSGIADRVSVAPLHNWAGTESLVRLGEKPLRKVCAKPFMEMAIHANGDVSPCCVDWSGQLKLGNVNVDTLKDIWEGNALERLRGAHLSGMRSTIPACMDCTMINQQRDNLDGLIPVTVS